MGWDPLCGLHDRIAAIQSSLNHLLHHPPVSTFQWTNYQESYCMEPSLLNISECAVCSVIIDNVYVCLVLYV